MTDKIAQITEKNDCLRQKVMSPGSNIFMKVYGYAAAIGKLEKLDPATQEILETAALLHDIGIKVSEEKYHSSAGKYQEIEGPAEARRLLMEAGADQELTHRVCWLIGHHHTYSNIRDIDHQILWKPIFWSIWQKNISQKKPSVIQWIRSFVLKAAFPFLKSIWNL